MPHVFDGIRHVVLDIDGTIIPLTFARDVLFPSALKTLTAVLESQWTSPEFQPYRSPFPASAQASPEAFEAYVRELTEQSSKTAYFKDLQGYLFQSAFHSSAISTPFFPDVRPALEHWRSSNIGISIYSAGSVFAQKLLFQHVSSDDPEDPKATVDDRGYVSEWIDTSLVSVKTSSESYVKVVEILKEAPESVLFLSDGLEELRAAREAGLQVLLVKRSGNAEVNLSEEDGKWLDTIESFDEIQLPSSSGKGEANRTNENLQKENAVSYAEDGQLGDGFSRSSDTHKTTGE